MTNIETIYFAGGCFWCTEAVFKHLKGVHGVLPGYMGGTVLSPTYEQICTGSTGHAEAIQITFDESVIPLAVLIEVFFATHNPTTLNKQGNDIGTQYRSAIFYTTPEQETVAKQALVEAQKLFPQPIVTEIVFATTFYPAEDYHREYYQNHSNQPYCMLVINPKLEKLEEQFADHLVPHTV